ncbi:hypothetical protein Avbf_13295 [Armadillidium vulgare]|nr:hypothetical protein Avbf_13295 [Armadillidium vulgare]
MIKIKKKIKILQFILQKSENLEKKFNNYIQLLILYRQSGRVHTIDLRSHLNISFLKLSKFLEKFNNISHSYCKRVKTSRRNSTITFNY